MSGYNNLKHKIVIFCQKYTMGESLADTISRSGLTKIPELHTPEFFNSICGADDLKKLKGEEYIENIREAIAANSDLNGFVTIVSKSFFNIARERIGKKDKSEAIDAWIDIFGNEAKYLLLDLKNFAFRAVLKQNEDSKMMFDILKLQLPIEKLESIYKNDIRNDEKNWYLNNFDNKEVLKVFLEDLIQNNCWGNIEKQIGFSLDKKELDVDVEEYEKLYKISKDNLSSLLKVRV
jgi:hypothetical protein